MFSFAKMKNAKLKSAIVRIYHIIYKKPEVKKAKLIGKEFAISMVGDVVKGFDVS